MVPPALTIFATVTMPSLAQDAIVEAELAPPGTLRVGLIEAPSAGLIFVSRSEGGTPKGATAELGADLAKSAGLLKAFTLFPNTGAAAAALQVGPIDVRFMPVDAIRRQALDFGPSDYDLESTDLASGASGITDVAQVAGRLAGRRYVRPRADPQSLSDVISFSDRAFVS